MLTQRPARSHLTSINSGDSPLCSLRPSYLFSSPVPEYIFPKEDCFCSAYITKLRWSRYPVQTSTVNLPNRVLEGSPIFRPQPVDTNTDILTIKKLRERNSVWSDGISFRFLKDALYPIAFYFTCIINTSIVTGNFPNARKQALVVPLFKGGDTCSVNNYSPISLLPIVSKTLERVVADQLRNYLWSNKLLQTSEHGFHPKLSTESTLTVITDNIYSNMDRNCKSLLTLRKLSTAFDSVSQTVLINKWAKLDVDSYWFRDYVNIT